MMEAEGGGSNWPHGGVQSDAFGVVQFLVQECDTYQPVLVTHEDPVVHVIHKVEVSSEPVYRHLLHIWTEKQGGWWNEKRRPRKSILIWRGLEESDGVDWILRGLTHCYIMEMSAELDEQPFQQLSRCSGFQMYMKNTPKSPALRRIPNISVFKDRSKEHDVVAEWWWVSGLNSIYFPEAPLAGKTYAPPEEKHPTVHSRQEKIKEESPEKTSESGKKRRVSRVNYVKRITWVINTPLCVVCSFLPPPFLKQAQPHLV